MTLPDLCLWVQGDEGNWWTACGNGTPSEGDWLDMLRKEN